MKTRRRSARGHAKNVTTTSTKVDTETSQAKGVAGRVGNAGVTSWGTMARLYFNNAAASDSLSGLLYQSYEAKIRT